MIFDSHAHYDDSRFDEDRDALLRSLSSRGVGYVLNAGCDLRSSNTSLKMAKKYKGVYAAVGIHPEFADTLDDDAISELIRLAENKKVRAIGEIGLDYHYEEVPRSIQRETFKRQLILAQQLRLPVIVHDREAHEDTLRIVSETESLRTEDADYAPGVFHCFSGSVEMAEILFKMGWYVSFTGVLTFKNSRRAKAVASMAPADRIMIETDCPYMAPEPYRGRRCDSSMLTSVARELAELRGITPEEAVELTCSNALKFFGIGDIDLD